MDAEEIRSAKPRFGRLGVGETMTLRLAGSACQLAPVFQSFPPRALKTRNGPGWLAIQNALSSPVDFVLFFVKPRIISEFQNVAVAVRAARELTQGDDNE